MKKILICIIFLFVSYGIAIGQTLYKIEKDGLYGYADSIGNEVIKPIYDFVFTDTLTHIAFVICEKKIIGINKQREKLLQVFNFDNGPDYVSEGLFRIINKKNEIGFADTLGNIIIEPQYKFAFPFKGGKAKVTNKGRSTPSGEYYYWKSKHWYYIKNPLLKIKK